MTYDVVITREGENWLADVPSVPGAHTFARSLPSLYESVREVIVLMDDLEDDAVPAVRYRLEVDDPLLAEAADLGRARAELAELEASVQARTGKTVAKLTESGYSVRDVAALVGVSPGRISQMTPQSREVARFATKAVAARAVDRIVKKSGARQTGAATKGIKGSSRAKGR